MTNKQTDQKLNRRGFLTAGAGAASAAAVAVAAPTSGAIAAESASDKTKARYNPNSENVKSFYRTNRY